MLAPNIYTACLAAIFAHTFFTGVRLARALTTLKLSNAPATLGVVMMAYALLPALLSPRVGRAVDRRGVQPVLHTCLWVLCGAGLALWWLPHHESTLIVIAAVVGLGFNGFAVSIQKLIGALPSTVAEQDMPATDRRKRNFGTLATASSISSFAGPLVAGWSLDHLGATSVFALLATLPLLSWALSLSWQLPAGIGPINEQKVNAPTTLSATSTHSPMLARELWPLAAAIILLTVAGDALGFLTPIIGQQQGLSATTVGGIVSAFSVGSFVIRLVSTLFIARLREWTYLCATVFACAVILLAFAHAPSELALALLSFILGAWLGLAQPMTQSLLHQKVPEHRVGEALGTRLALVGIAQSASPLVFGVGAQTLGVAPTLALASLLLASGGAYMIWGAKQ